MLQETLVFCNTNISYQGDPNTYFFQLFPQLVIIHCTATDDITKFATIMPNVSIWCLLFSFLFFILLIKLTFKLKVFLPVAVIVLQEFIAFEDHMPCCWPYRLQSMRSSLWSSGGLTKNKVTEKFSGKVFCPLSLWALSIWFFRSLSESCLPAIGNRGPWGPLEANIEVCDVMVAWLFIVVVVSCPSMVGPIPWLRLLPSNGWWFWWVGGNTPAGCPLVLTL